MGYITAAVTPTEWAPALRPYTTLLRYSTDARPKVRKRAQSSLVDVLAALQGTPALQGASEAVLKGESALLTLSACCSSLRQVARQHPHVSSVFQALHLYPKQCAAIALPMVESGLPVIARQVVPCSFAFPIMLDLCLL